MMPNLFTNPLEAIKQWRIPVWVVLRWAAVVGLVWQYSGDFVKGQAGDVLDKMLLERGMSKEAIEIIKNKVSQIDGDTDKIKADINTILSSQGQSKARQDELKYQVDRLVDYLINKKASNP